VTEVDEKQTLRRYLQEARDALLWKLEGLSDYDIRRPMTPTGTNLLGLVKHCAAGECVYFGRVHGRPFPGEGSGDAPGEDDAAGWKRHYDKLENIARLAGDQPAR
jgi:hypothetical protein